MDGNDWVRHEIKNESGDVTAVYGETLVDKLKQLHDTGTEIDGYFVCRVENIDPNTPIEFDDTEQRYLEQLNMAVIFAQQAYFNAVAFMRCKYEAPENEWALNNINVGFERIKQA